MAEVAAAEVPARAQWLPKRGGSRSSSVLPRSPCSGHPLPWVGGLRGEAFCWALPPLWRGRQPRTPGQTAASHPQDQAQQASPAGGGSKLQRCPCPPALRALLSRPPRPRGGGWVRDSQAWSPALHLRCGTSHLDPREVRWLRGASGGRWGGRLAQASGKAPPRWGRPAGPRGPPDCSPQERMGPERSKGRPQSHARGGRPAQAAGCPPLRSVRSPGAPQAFPACGLF